ncbi:MAG: LysR family transcriptional regulator [Pseudomonadota bacterium]
MLEQLDVGVGRTEQLVVDAGRVIDFLGPRGRVYSSPSMVMDMEWCCWYLLNMYLRPDESSVGVYVEWHHLTGTPLGQQVTVTATIAAVEGRQVSFTTQIHDRFGIAGHGSHKRVVVEVERHLGRLEQRFPPSTAT